GAVPARPRPRPAAASPGWRRSQPRRTGRTACLSSGDGDVGEPAEELAVAARLGEAAHLLDEAAARGVAVGAALRLVVGTEPRRDHRPGVRPEISGAQVQLLDAVRDLAQVVAVEEATPGP